MNAWYGEPSIFLYFVAKYGRMVLNDFLHE